MIPGLDSATTPGPTALAAAKAAGIRIWSGYISTAPYDGGSHFMLWHPWPKAAFDACQGLGSTPIAYASGLDNPAALKSLAASWGVRLCLDVENGIRGDGSWVQPWLDASGAGLYGNAPVHNGRNAPFHILAGYPGYNPKATWPAWLVRPAGLVAWQWQGTHDEFGVGVDSCWFDDGFAGLHGGGSGSLEGEDLTPEESTLLHTVASAVTGGYYVDSTGTDVDTQLHKELKAIAAGIAALGGKGGGSVDLTPVLAAIADLKAHPASVADPSVLAIVTRIETALKGA